MPPLLLNTNPTNLWLDRRVSVVIIGAGVSGLYAASELARHGIDYVVLEARSGAGGRILSVSAGVGSDLASSEYVEPGVRFDLGPTWYWPAMQADLDRVIRALGLATFAQFEDGDTLVERPARSGVGSIQDPSGRGVDIHRTHGYAASVASSRLQGGMQSLIDALAQRLDPARVFYSKRVTRLELAMDQGGCPQSAPKPVTSGPGDAGVRVWVQSGDDQQSMFLVHAQAVLLAMPPRLVAENLTFDPALPPDLIRQWRQTATWMAPHAKYLAVYRSPFWRRAGLSGQARSHVGPMVEIHDASPPDQPTVPVPSSLSVSGSSNQCGALFGFLGVPAHVRASVPEEQIKALCRAQLVRLFGHEARVPVAEFLKDWACDPLTATALDRQPDAQAQGHAPAPDIEPRQGPWQSRIIGIASEWSSRFPGYVAGAIEAANLGVQKVLGHRVS